MPRMTELVRVDYRKEMFRTRKAVCIELEDLREVWVPLSLIHDENQNDKWILVEEWVAKKESML